MASGEEVKYEFSIGKGWRLLGLVSFTVISLSLFSVSIWFAVLILLTVAFYFGFYLKAANNYALTNKRILVRRGLFSISTVSIDYGKITDVTVLEPFFESGLAKTGSIAINTAGTDVLEVVLRHITNPIDVKKRIDELKR